MAQMCSLDWILDLNLDLRPCCHGNDVAVVTQKNRVIQCLWLNIIEEYRLTSMYQNKTLTL